MKLIAKLWHLSRLGVVLFILSLVLTVFVFINLDGDWLIYRLYPLLLLSPSLLLINTKLIINKISDQKSTKNFSRLTIWSIITPIIFAMISIILFLPPSIDLLGFGAFVFAPLLLVISFIASLILFIKAIKKLKKIINEFPQNEFNKLANYQIILFILYSLMLILPAAFVLWVAQYLG